MMLTEIAIKSAKPRGRDYKMAGGYDCSPSAV